MYRPCIAIVAFLMLCGLYTGCKQPAGQAEKSIRPVTNAPDTAFIPLILSQDTLGKQILKDTVKTILAALEKGKNKDEDPWYYYFRGYQQELNKQPDSAVHYYRRMEPGVKDSQLLVLQAFSILNLTTDASNITKAERAEQILEAIKKAEKSNSIFLYRLYDLLARSYYANGNIAQSATYTRLYYNNNPFKAHPIIRQRYFDICFLLAARINDLNGMQRYQDSARRLAIQIADSMALVRTYDYEAQIHSRTGELAKSIDCEKVYFNYMKAHDRLNTIVFNNLATSFVRNNQLDSAIYYYNACIDWAAKKGQPANLFSAYEGLTEAYRKKGDYKNALAAFHQSFETFARNNDSIEASKIEELHTRYQTEKKDQAIAGLRTTNILNRKIISQQRWIFIVICTLLVLAAFFVYNIYRQRLLREKNEKLQIDNKRLLLEQKTRQMQLDPHFIYNAVANLQGLISSDRKQEANAYLVSFSRLMRNILELNREDFISVEEEIGALDNYIRLQQMRFTGMFDYSIDADDIDVSDILIPPMLIQPFVENAIEHGFKTIDYKGFLQITFRQEQEQLVITIDDNGVGNKGQTGQQKEKKSLSQIIIQERLDLLFNKEQQRSGFSYNTKPSGKGFVVIVTIPLITA
ncbi:MAG: histidine kinase [Chitinophaga sp.]|uniref:tetratricopeptide repeat-containing sensor histidine kinase n=1 Tax=Chitinophaga sp. TaxID=1869181 RepID=UPI001B22B66D|nr:histidine kinase [Chitinophaga sp.]MBO9729710.1 histidine kinase [Chitinophaga sp.]